MIKPNKGEPWCNPNLSKRGLGKGQQHKQILQNWREMIMKNMHTICPPRIQGMWPFRGEAGHSGGKWYHLDLPSDCRREIKQNGIPVALL